uniref:MARVEL domain-containing protein n=1 Tax=Strongyloides venezuelensis TaxID=75913 RepID=A0A0K0EVK6_STRVS
MNTFIEPGGTLNFQRRINNISIIKPNNYRSYSNLYSKKKMKGSNKLIKSPNYIINLDHYEEMVRINSKIHIHNNLCCYNLFNIKSVAYFIGYLEILSLVVLTSYYITQLIVHGFSYNSIILIPMCIIQLCLTIILYQGLKTLNTILLIMSLIGFIGRIVFSLMYTIISLFYGTFKESDDVISDSNLSMVRYILIGVYTFIMVLSSYVIYRCYSYFKKITSILT